MKALKIPKIKAWVFVQKRQKSFPYYVNFFSGKLWKKGSKQAHTALALFVNSL
jgi:hypothetical protein